jgi:hypothetical protein
VLTAFADSPLNSPLRACREPPLSARWLAAMFADSLLPNQNSIPPDDCSGSLPRVLPIAPDA